MHKSHYGLLLRRPFPLRILSAMLQPDFRIIALDVDGTLLDTSGRVSPAFMEAIERLARRGVHTVLCTGRRWRTAFQVVVQIRHAHPVVVCCGGALIKEADGHRTLYRNLLGSAAAQRTVAAFRRGGLVPFLLLDRPLSDCELLISELDRARASRLPYILANPDGIQYYSGEYPELQEDPVEVYTVDHLSRVRPCEGAARAELGDEAIVTALLQRRYGPDQFALEVHCPTATKWNALRWLLRQWNFGPEQVIAIGDDVNDIPMLRGAGMSFAMGNAPPQVQAAAARITASNDQDGVVAALRSVFPDALGR